MKDILGQKIYVNDYCFSTEIESFHNRELQLFKIVKINPKTIKIQKHNKPKAKLLYKYPKEIIKIDITKHPELIL